jgi:hypothetical protein
MDFWFECFDIQMNENLEQLAMIAMVLNGKTYIFI